MITVAEMGDGTQRNQFLPQLWQLCILMRIAIIAAHWLTIYTYVFIPSLMNFQWPLHMFRLFSISVVKTVIIENA